MTLDHLNIKKNIPLRELTTFGIGGPARYYLRAETDQEFIQAWQAARREGVPVFILGGGSNILVSDHGFNGLVIHVATRGITTLAEDEETITLKVAAGENLDQFIAQTTESGWWGIENLSLIPGRVGAFPIQNVGAYGQDAGGVVQSVEVWDSHSRAVKNLPKSECHFGYRTSIFNTTQNGRYLILHVVMELSKVGQPNLSYQGLRDFFAEELPTTPGQMRDAVTRIRKSKLPDPAEIGSAGSFFKNIILNEEEFARLQTHAEKHLPPGVIAKLNEFRERFPNESGIKIPTAYVIESCGFARGAQSEGATLGGAALSPNHALIMTNATGHATAAEVMRLARRVRQTVHAKTGLAIHIEPTLVGFSQEELDGYFELGK
ncbi:MAG: UDP-N-acetylmuramate dehydrogenase [Chloroflexota bacterium]|nr:UDP-N-acetylmuramate dehydrogenase [Chloroflexota bacterium]